MWNREQFGDTYKKIEEDLNKMEEETTNRQLKNHERNYRQSSKKWKREKLLD